MPEDEAATDATSQLLVMQFVIASAILSAVEMVLHCQGEKEWTPVVNNKLREIKYSQKIILCC